MIQIASTALALVLAIVFAAWILMHRNRDVSAYALSAGLLACVALEVFDLAALLDPGGLEIWKRGALFSEALLPPAWLIFSQTFSREGGLRRLSLLQKTLLALSPVFLVSVLFFAPGEFFYAPDFPDEMILFLGRAGYIFYIGVLLFLVFALVNLERTLIFLSRPEQWKVKFEIVGAGALLAMLVVYYSQGILYRSIDMSLMPARTGALIFAIIMMGYSRLRRGEAVRIQVSRDMAYRSVVILAVGLYLIGLGLIGEGMRYFGEAYQRTLFVGISFLFGVGVLVLFLSESVKRKIKVFLHKNFYQSKYDYRTQWLRFTERLSSARNETELQKAILSVFSEIFAVKGALLFLKDGEGGTYRVRANHEMRENRLVLDGENSLVRYLRDKPSWIFSVRDDSPRIRIENRNFLERDQVSFVIPLQFDRKLEGFIALGESINRNESYTYEDYDLMKVMARQATAAILSLKLAEQLSTSREMAAIGKVSAFVMHDLKNVVSNLGLTAENAGEYIGDPEFQKDMLETLTGSVGKMKTMISRLKNLEEKTELNLETYDLMEIILKEARSFSSHEIQVLGQSVQARIDRMEFSKVILNLILNGLEACERKSPVMVEVGQNKAGAFVKIADRGCGMSEDYIKQRLFKAFETTKKKGFGIGLYQCRNIVEAHGGSIEVGSRLGKGSEFIVSLPPLKEVEIGNKAEMKPGEGTVAQDQSRSEKNELGEGKAPWPAIGTNER